MEEKDFVKHLAQAENLNFDILKYIMSNIIEKETKIIDFISDFTDMVKKYDIKDISLLFIHLYFLIVRMNEKELEEQGFLNIFSIFKRMESGIFSDNNLQEKDIN